MIDPDLKQQIQHELRSGEKLIWTGRPQGIQINRIALIYTIIMSLFMSIFAVAILSEFPDQLIWMLILAAIIILPGALMINSPSKETYFLTTQCIIIHHRLMTSRFRLGDRVSIEPARFAGKNSLKVIEKLRDSRRRKSYRVGVLHGLKDPDGFLSLISGLEYKISAEKRGRGDGASSTLNAN